MNVPALPIARYRLLFAAAEPVSLPAFAGSAWRGAFGGALKRLACVTHAAQCPPCPLWRGCAYPYLFATPPRADVGLVSASAHGPLPMVFAVPMHADARLLEAGATTELDVNVFGHGNRYVAYLVHALAQAGECGIGKRRGALRLTGVLQHDGTGWQPIRSADGSLSPRAPFVPAVAAMPARVRMTLTTPLRLRVKDSYLGPQQFQVDALLIGLLRRISQLVAHHTDAPLATDFRALKTAARSVTTLDGSLRWHEMARWSARQQALLQNGGLLGELLFDGSTLAPFWPLLWLGQWTHAGKNAAMGLGRYVLSAE